MKPRMMPVLEQCIENGVRLGWNRAHKNHDAPLPEYIQDCIEQSIWSELHEWFQFEQPSEQSQD
jgi:DNA polymerase III alpha subunit (gram-positive type)